MSKKHIGSSFDNFLKEEELLEEIKAKALKNVIVLFIEQELKKEYI